jgi:tRNA U34 5-methylaminomethyl-2-thiouridine-forming methyltransferase MnmC
MKRELIITRDGSHTLAIPEMKVMYHSIHGAIKESMHVYIQAGLHYALSQFSDTPLRIFEMGFGSGLNAMLTAMEAEKVQRLIHYTSAEAYPLTIEEIQALNYGMTLKNELLFKQLHEVPWSQEVTIHSFFILKKLEVDLFNFSTNQSFHLIYYDAFAPAAQPELWTQEAFELLFQMLVLGGILVTYCSKGNVRRAMQAAGFTVSKLQGPPGKREMLKAQKV